MKRLIALTGIAAILVFLTGCSMAIPTKKIDEQMYNSNLTKSFDYSKDKCFKATLAVLKESKTGIEKQDRNKGVIITERTAFNDSSEGVEGLVSFTTYEHQYFFQITGGADKAVIKVYKYRYWKNKEEQIELNEFWFEDNVWNPLFNKIFLNLQNM